jgi:UPF0755 protein
MYSLKGNKSRRHYLVLGILTLILLVLVSAAVFVRNTYNRNVQPVSNDQTVSIVTIASGSSVNDVALLLEEKGLIRSAWAFEWYVRGHNVRDKLQAGSYAFKPSMSVEDMVRLITTGKVATDLFTILPAQRIDQIQAAFVKAGYSVDTVEKAFTPAQYEGHPALTDKPKEASLEGYLYPESFQKTATTTPDTIIAASLDEMAKALSPEVRAGFTRQGLTVHQGVILASIVEKEVSSTSDRQKVAQVFLKRLRTGMMLGSDVTAYYGADVAGLPHTVDTDTPYNTRLHAGYPPGPIGNTSKSSLQAVADPATTDYLYFVAGDDGVTYFSRSLDEHNANVAAHCHKNCEE